MLVELTKWQRIRNWYAPFRYDEPEPIDDDLDCFTSLAYNRYSRWPRDHYIQMSLW